MPWARRVLAALIYTAIVLAIALAIALVLRVAWERTERLPGQGFWSPAALGEMDAREASADRHTLERPSGEPEN